MPRTRAFRPLKNMKSQHPNSRRGRHVFPLYTNAIRMTGTLAVSALLAFPKINKLCAINTLWSSWFESMPGSHTFSIPTEKACFVDHGTLRLYRPYPPHSAGSCVWRVLSGWKRGLAGLRVQPPGLRPNPTFSLANSPVSPVDRSPLLTVLSNMGCHGIHGSGYRSDPLNLDK